MKNLCSYDSNFFKYKDCWLFVSYRHPRHTFTAFSSTLGKHVEQHIQIIFHSGPKEVFVVYMTPTVYMKTVKPKYYTYCVRHTIKACTDHVPPEIKTGKITLCTPIGHYIKGADTRI